MNGLRGHHALGAAGAQRHVYSQLMSKGQQGCLGAAVYPMFYQHQGRIFAPLMNCAVYIWRQDVELGLSNIEIHSCPTFQESVSLPYTM